MAIEETMRKILADHDEPANPDFERLRQFYEEKKKEGLVRKQEYTLPPMDTVGRTSFQWSWNRPVVPNRQA
jgi:hypothetical protein